MTAGGIDADAVRGWLLGLQDRIVSALEQEGGDAFGSDRWKREPGGPLAGEGITRIVEGGTLLERGGCGFSHVKGVALPASATAHRGPALAGAPFEAMGVSLVFHPRNPFVPTVHMNVRMLVAMPAGGEPVVWFGGGMDLTPYYGDEADARHFHTTCRDAVAPFGAELHPRFKRWCDEYFFLKHRGEPRGIGGIFFDDHAEGGFAPGFALIRAVGDALLPAYLPIVQRRRDTPYGERERDFQAYRRGRYVEFNLVLDRGTHFGLQSGGRTESILMSMPPVATWRYDWQPEPGSAEARLYTEFLRPRDWAGEAGDVKRVGLFGGSFDPVHLAHVALARQARDQLRLDELRWIPVGLPWQKSRQLADPGHREAMVRLAIAGEDRFVLDRIELRRRGTSYTLDTVRELHAAEPDVAWFLLLGQDQYAGLHTWRDWRELLGMVTLAVANRPDAPPPVNPQIAGIDHEIVALPPMDVSSTEVRRRVAAGESIANLVPATVARYIEQHRLYTAAG